MIGKIHKLVECNVVRYAQGFGREMDLPARGEIDGAREGLSTVTEHVFFGSIGQLVVAGDIGDKRYRVGRHGDRSEMRREVSFRWAGH